MISASTRALVFLYLLASAAHAEAAIREWSPLPDDGHWSNGNNWQGGSIPQPGDDLLFPAAYFDGILINDLANGIAIRSIAFDFPEYTLTGNAITFAGPAHPFNIGCTTAHNFGEGNVVSVPVILAGDILLEAVPGCSLTLSGGISGVGGLTAGGGGPVILSGEHSYSGATKLVNGALIIDGILSGTSAVEIHASSGTSTLRGTGTFTGPLRVEAVSSGASAVVAPGMDSATGVLSTGAATFGWNAALAVRLNGRAAGEEHDQLDVTGGVDLGSTTRLDIALGFAPPIGTTFTIIKNGTGSAVSGNFEGLPESTAFVASNTTFQISYVGGGGHDVVLTVVPTFAMPAALAVDPGGNGVLEPGELVTLQPAWTNTSGGSLHLTGATSNLTGPAGAVYVNPDADGDYGTIPDEASAPCTDCYSVRIDAASRPAPHWDAAIDETVSPSSITRTWALHIGQSFPDVPTSHPFYPFIETLFHDGVTGGCGAGDYCPGNDATRAQMAVFLLKSAHGSAYVPPACSSTVFLDVPCPGGPFVDWVNQLASEGVTGGCGGGLYCPFQPILRAQMAVFLLKGEHGGSYAPPPCAETMFSDVPCPGAPFVDWINQLAAEGVTGGCGGGLYCPGDSVSRGEMAVFLGKTFGLPLYGL